MKKLMELFDVTPRVASTLAFIVGFLLLSGTIAFFKSAPPKHLRMITGPEGSTFHETGLKYAKAMAQHGVKVEILTSTGSLENLHQLSNPKAKIDLALVQGGLFNDEVNLQGVVSLGTIRHQPLFFFYRGKDTDRLTNMRGKRLAIGAEGSGTRKLALKLLALNKIKPEENEGTKLLDLKGKYATQALIAGEVDGLFIMTGDASLNDLKKLMRAENVKLMSFKNASAYMRRIDALHNLDLPEGVIDFSRNLPPQTVKLVSVMAEIVAKESLHSAISDLVLDAATAIHGDPGLFQKRGEFPAPIAHDMKLSEDAQHFYKSGKTLLYRHLPFWLASLTGRFFVVFLPILLLIIPLVRTTPAMLRWMGELKIRRRYKTLLKIEREIKATTDGPKLDSLYKEFESVEQDVRNMRVRPAFAEQFYFLRVHIDYVRKMISRKEV